MNRLRLIWNIIRGRPVCYRMTLHGDIPMLIGSENIGGLIVDSTFIFPEQS